MTGTRRLYRPKSITRADIEDAYERLVKSTFNTPRVNAAYHAFVSPQAQQDILRAIDGQLAEWRAS